MVRMLPFNPEYTTNHYFVVYLKNPDQTGLVKGHCVCIYTYIDDIAIVAAIVRACTKYEFTISPTIETQVVNSPDKWSINQAVHYLRRLRFIKKSVVKKTKTIEWEEEVEEVL